MVFFGLGGFFYISVLLINAVAILSEDRFLARIGLSTTSRSDSFGGHAGGADESFKGRTIMAIASVRTLTRIPLIGVNTLIIIYALVLG